MSSKESRNLAEAARDAAAKASKQAEEFRQSARRRKVKASLHRALAALLRAKIVAPDVEEIDRAIEELEETLKD